MGLRRFIHILRASYATRRIRQTSKGKILLAMVWILILSLGIYGVFIGLTVPEQKAYREIAFQDFMNYVKTGQAESYFLKFGGQERSQQSGPYEVKTSTQYKRNLIIFAKLRGSEIVKTKEIEYSVISYTSFERKLKEGIIEDLIVPASSGYGLCSAQDSLFLVNFDWSYIDKKDLLQLCLANEANLWELPVSSVPEEPARGISDPKWSWLFVFAIFFGGYLIAIPIYNHEVTKREAERIDAMMPIGERVTFDDIGAQDEAKEIIRKRVLHPVKNPEHFVSAGIIPPRGVLLYGPPGNGKTLLGKALACELGGSFIYTTGPELGPIKYVGTGVEAVKQIFDKARAKAKTTGQPVVIFIDEADGIGRRTGESEGAQEQAKTIQLLNAEIDGMKSMDKIIVVFATNTKELIDPALLRTGRVDYQILVPRPDLKGRRVILEIHSRKRPLAKSVDLDKVAEMTSGFSGSDLARVMNEAGLEAVLQWEDGLRKSKDIEMKDIVRAIEEVMVGSERKGIIMTDEDKERGGYHEGGHTVIALNLPELGTVQKVTIMPTTKGAGGYTKTSLDRDRYYWTKTEFLAMITLLYGGRVAEIRRFGLRGISTGAQDDFAKATTIAEEMVLKYGMAAEKLGPRTFGAPRGLKHLGQTWARKEMSEEMKALVDQEINKILKECYSRAEKILEENADLLKLIAKTLKQKETLNQEDIEQLLKDFKSMKNMVKGEKGIKLPEGSEDLIWKIAENGKINHWQRLKELFGSPIEALKGLLNKSSQKNNKGIRAKNNKATN